jgi:hypothetical protein
MHSATRGRWAFGLTAAAFLWALALIPAAFLVPVYGTETVGNAVPSSVPPVPTPSASSATLIGVNGISVRLLVVLALPSAFALIAWGGLHRACAKGSVRGRRVAGTAIALLGVLTVLTGFSIGEALVPALLLLVAARKLTPLSAMANP